MIQIQIPDSLKKILKISFILVFLSVFVVVFIGTAADGVNTDIKKLNKFLLVAENIKPNFEKSLQIYTEQSQYVTEYLLGLRPDSEEELVGFISDVEALGQKLGIDLDLQTVDGSESEDENLEKYIEYTVTFYGTMSDLKKFLFELETLNYFIGMDSIDFKNLEFADETASPLKENNKIILRLYIK